MGKTNSSPSNSDLREALEKVRVARELLSDAVILTGGRATTDDLRAFPRNGKVKDVKLCALRISITGHYDGLSTVYKIMKKTTEAEG